MMGVENLEQDTLRMNDPIRQQEEKSKADMFPKGAIGRRSKARAMARASHCVCVAFDPSGRMQGRER